MGRSAMSDRPDWITYFDTIAQAVALRGDCERYQVGAVITDANHFIIATGYNGFQKGQGCRGDYACPRGLLSRSPLPEKQAMAEYLHCHATHAEVNALRTASRTHLLTEGLIGGTMYVTRLPCRECVAEAQRHGIKTIYAEGRQINVPRC